MIKRVSHPTVKTKVIRSFQFMDETYQIVRISKKHLLCDAVWSEYVVMAPEPDENYASWYAYKYNIRDTNKIEK